MRFRPHSQNSQLIGQRENRLTDAAKWAGVPRTHQTHFVEASGKEKLMVDDTSDSTEFRQNFFLQKSDTEIVDSTPSATDIENTSTLGKDDSEVNEMHRSDNGWKWSMNPVSILYDKTDILRHIKSTESSWQLRTVCSEVATVITYYCDIILKLCH